MVKIASAAAGAVVFAAAVAGQATINTPPSITQCQPAALQWTGATGAVRIAILPAGQVSAAPIENLPDQSGASGSYVWTVNVASGTNITISINDGSGVANYASPLVVLPSSDDSCLNAAASSSSSSSGAAAGGAPSSTAASSSATSSRASSSSSRAATSSSSAPTSSATSGSSSTTGGSSASSSSSAPAQTTHANAAVAFSPATAGLSVLAAAGALLPFL